MPKVQPVPGVPPAVPAVQGDGQDVTTPKPLKHSQRVRIAPILAAALQAGMVHVQRGQHDIDAGYRCTACLRIEHHAPSCAPPRGLVPSETEPADVCRWCAHTRDGGPRTGPFLVDENGMDVAVSKERRAMRWAHCWDDGWWDCDAAMLFPDPEAVEKALDEHRAKAVKS